MGVLARGVLTGRAVDVEWLFTDRRDGVSAGPYASMNVGMLVEDDPADVARNRQLVAGYLGVDRLAVMRQVHGRDVVRVEASAPTPPEADALITRTPGVAVTVQVADCVPVLLADPASGQVAAVHAGWRGVAAGVVGATLEEMRPVGDVSAWVGPAICPGCYEVSAQVRDEVADVVPAAASTTRAGTPALDVRAGVLAQLAEYGILGVPVGGCTFEDPSLFSFRRASTTGRQAGIVLMRRTDA